MPIFSYATESLTDTQVRERFLRDGYNELPSQKKQSVFHMFLHILSEPMLLLLLVAGGLYVALGELGDALMLLTFVFVVIGITFYQEHKTERTLEALRDLSSPRALVIRNGQQIRIPGREVVRDDILILREGDRVPADAIILEQENISIDESLLTGESVPVRKIISGNKEWKHTRPGGDDLPFVYSGTLVVSGHGVVRVLHTGVDTEMGKIGKAIQSVKEESTLLHKETAKIVRLATLYGLGLCVIVAVVYTLVQKNILQGLLAGLTLSMALLPEEFPVVLLVFLTLGAWRISKHNVLTRKADAIETLGAATVLCVDKTGTLTKNKMTLMMLQSGNTYHEVGSVIKAPLADSFHRLLEYAMLASQRDPYDPIEKEINAIGSDYLKNTEHIHDHWRIVREYPLSKKLLALSHVWKSNHASSYVIAAKGAPEAIAELCHVTKKEQKDMMVHIQEMSGRGLRLIGVAKASFSKKTLPDSQHDFHFEFVGLLGFADPVRENVPAAIGEAYSAGIRVMMMTGDYPGTATWIAREAGITNPDIVVEGKEMAEMSHEELKECMRKTNVFARIMPEQKLLIVQALKANHEIVAMTGDGVNDAPALKAAHIGIAMGERGTDVAREASELVLLDDDFSSIVSAVRMGRRIYENLKRAMGYIIAVHVPIAGLSLLLPLFHFPLILLPAHIAFLELIIDPACSTVFEAEPEDDDIMKRPPRRLSSRLFDTKTMVFSAFQGVSILAAVLILYIVLLSGGKNELIARSMAFAALVFADLFLILTNLSWKKSIMDIIKRPNPAFWWVVGGTISGISIVFLVPFFRDIFHFGVLRPVDYAWAVAVGVMSLLWFEGMKLFRIVK